MKKKCDFHQLVINIKKKGYQIRGEDQLYTIVLPFIIRRREQVEYQEFLRYWTILNKKKAREQKKLKTLEEAYNPSIQSGSPFLTLRSGQVIYHEA